MGWAIGIRGALGVSLVERRAIPCEGPVTGGLSMDITLPSVAPGRVSVDNRLLSTDGRSLQADIGSLSTDIEGGRTDIEPVSMDIGVVSVDISRLSAAASPLATDS